MLESRALRGAVAQLGERRVRNAKVEGSIPFRSTTFLRYVPITWVTVYTGDMGNTFALKGFSALVMRHVS